MTKIAVSIPDDIYRTARLYAAERGSSVSELVVEYLSSLADHSGESALPEAQQKTIQEEILRFSARPRLDRDELHRRTVR